MPPPFPPPPPSPPFPPPSPPPSPPPPSPPPPSPPPPSPPPSPPPFPPPLPPPPAEDCSRMCIYVTAALDAMSVPNTIAPAAGSPAAAASLRHLIYHSTTDYHQPQNALANDHYAHAGAHPSERVIGKLEPNANYHRVDVLQVDSVVGPTSAPMVPTTGAPMVPTTLADSAFIGSQTHHYAYGTCENLGACATGSLVGSSCSLNQRFGAAQAGYCYLS